MAHITTICHVRFPKLENRLANVFRKFMLFLCLLVLRYSGKKKRPLPQYLVCDKSLKRTHDIGHFAVMTLPCSRFPDHKTETALYSLLSKVLKQKTGVKSRQKWKSFLHLIRAAEHHHP